MKLILAKESIIMLKRCFVIFAQIAVKVRNFNFTFKSCFLNVFTLLFLCGGVVFSSPVFATVIYEKNLITQSSYRKTSKIYKLQFNNQDNYYEVSSVTGDCAFSSGVITSAQNNVDWNVRMGLTSHFGGKQAYLENVPVTDFNGIASQVGRKSDWGGVLDNGFPQDRAGVNKELGLDGMVHKP